MVKLTFSAIGLHKLSPTPPGFKAGQYCNTDKKALPFQRLSSYNSIYYAGQMDVVGEC